MIDKTINYDECSLEELEELQAKYSSLSKKFHNQEQAVKLTLNSIYGAFGNEYFYFYNIDLAEAITKQGKDAILYTEHIMNDYFNKFWHLDTTIHKKMGIEIKGKVLNPVVVYIDTDSNYVTFEEVIAKCNWKGTQENFIFTLYELRLKEYIEKALDKYSNFFNTDSYLKFEMESIAYDAIFISKKKYIQDLAWKDPDIHFNKLKKIKSKGFEIVQSSTPVFARTKLKDLVTYIFSVDKLELADLVKLLKKIKKEFKLSNIDLLTKNIKIGNYQKYIRNDYNVFEIESRCPIHVRGAGYHNYILNNSKYKLKYQLLNDGDKAKMYYSIDKSCNVFSYNSGNFPYEFAPKIDFDMQFEKTIIEPINRVIHAIGLQRLDRNLIYTASLF